MDISKITYDAQIKLADYCRTGEESEIPGVKRDRLHHYRRLVYNIIYGNLKQAYPIAYKVLDTEEWDMLVADFMKIHEPQTPKIWLLPFEFYQFVRDQDYVSKLNKVWLNDLLYFEWMEIEVYTMEDVESEVNVSKEGDIMKDLISINPEFRLMKIEYPVHLHAVDHVEDKKGNYFILLIREPETGRVEFFNLSILHLWVIQKIVDGNKVIDVIDEASEVFKIPNLDELSNHLKKFLTDLLNKKAFQGFVGKS